MRARVAIAGLVCGLLGLATDAGATDLPVQPVGGDGYYGYDSWRAEPLWIIDDQPGVVIRPYWLPPWRNRHYFPATGKRPRVGRLEKISATRRYKPAASYYRSWSTSSPTILSEDPRGSVPSFDGTAGPPLEPSLK